MTPEELEESLKLELGDDYQTYEEAEAEDRSHLVLSQVNYTGPNMSPLTESNRDETHIRWAQSPQEATAFLHEWFNFHHKLSLHWDFPGRTNRYVWQHELRASMHENNTALLEIVQRLDWIGSAHDNINASVVIAGIRAVIAANLVLFETLRPHVNLALMHYSLLAIK